jgi:YbgC/YbaW family acyl-CoA thioester hydrolase
VRALPAGDEMAYEFKTLRRVEFADTDVAGIVHFANYFRFLEAAEHEFFRSLGIRLHGASDGRMFGWARVHASCDYLRPARYPDLLEIHLVVREKTRSALRYDGTIHVVEDENSDQETPGKIAQGKLEVVYVEQTAGEPRMRAVDMPEAVSRLVEAAPS